jgi:2-hydroxychromene-2-carboxylate isomerase
MELPLTRHDGGGAASEEDAPQVYLDIASPESLLVAERALHVLPVAAEWVPVDLGAPDEVDWAALEATVAARGLQRVRRPPFPFDATWANLTWTYAKQIGRTVAFGQAALRQAYAGGWDLSVPDHVLVAASGCEMHPAAILKAVETRGVRRALEEATARARSRGLERAPGIWAAGRMLPGDRGLDAAAAALAERRG